MVRKSSNGNPGYVTVDECKRITRSFRNDLGVIKKALVGPDLRGGLVADVSEIKTKVNNGGNGLSKKNRVAIYSSLIVSSGLVIVEIVKGLF